MNTEHKSMQMSEAFITSVFLALSGGFQDAYTYFTRDGVFSNAQTGNVVLMSQHFMTGEWIKALHYLLPLLAFAAGVLVAEQIQNKFQYARRLHWRQGILLCEILILFIVGFIPTAFNMVATALVSFACAMQVQTFRKVSGYSLPAQCVSVICEAELPPYPFISVNIKRTSYASPYITSVLFCSLQLVQVSVVICPHITDFIQSGSLMDSYVSALC